MRGADNAPHHLDVRVTIPSVTTVSPQRRDSAAFCFSDSRSPLFKTEDAGR